MTALYLQQHYSAGIRWISDLPPLQNAPCVLFKIETAQAYSKKAHKTFAIAMNTFATLNKKLFQIKSLKTGKNGLTIRLASERLL